MHQCQNDRPAEHERERDALLVLLDDLLRVDMRGLPAGLATHHYIGAACQVVQACRQETLRVQWLDTLLGKILATYPELAAQRDKMRLDLSTRLVHEQKLFTDWREQVAPVPEDVKREA